MYVSFEEQQLEMAYHKGQPAPNRGIPHTEKTRKKISDTCKEIGVGKWNIGLIRTKEHRKLMSEGIQEWHYRNKHNKFEQQQEEEVIA